jgi:hypothetical protein
MAPQDIAKTAIITMCGLFEYLCMPFGPTGFSGNRRCAAGRLFGDGRTAAILPRSCRDAVLWQHAVHITSGRGRFLAWGCVNSTGVFRPLVPIQWFSSRCTPSITSGCGQHDTWFCWPQMAKAITLMARVCLFCQRGKVHKHMHLQPADILVPYCSFAHIPSITAADCARAGWISRFGVLATITSDRGAQFTSALWAALCSMININHSPTTAYHPQTNGLVERFHRRLKDALRSRAAATDWHNHLP